MRKGLVVRQKQIMSKVKESDDEHKYLNLFIKAREFVGGTAETSLLVRISLNGLGI